MVRTKGKKIIMFGTHKMIFDEIAAIIAAFAKATRQPISDIGVVLTLKALEKEKKVEEQNG